MKIKFLEDYLFVRRGTTYNLNQFSVLTGKNGSGKTSLLNGISRANVEIDGKSNKEIDIRTYNYNSFQNRLNKDEFNVSVYGDSIMNQFWLSYSAYKNEGKKSDKDFSDIASYFKKDVNDLSEEDFMNYPISRKNENLDLFTLNFFNDTANYLAILDKNDYNEFRNNKYRENNIVFSKTQFVDKYGIPPWESINKIFQETGLDYEFDISYRINRDDRVKVQLIDKINNEWVDVKYLSHGEQTIISIISLIYNLSIVEDLPDLFLFDEPDALLHPDYSRKLISILYNYLVGKRDKKVIITTHSPSTVAIVPSDSIFVCEKQLYTFKKTSKDKALNELTHNINSLSVLYENRRQVFVESRNDVIYYEKLYKKLSSRLIPEISLSFISSGESRTDKNGIKVSNCDQVKNIASILKDSGNKFVYGIIDWDLENKTNANIIVLGNGNRYSIENYLLDPLLIAALLLREKIIPRRDLLLLDGEGYFSFKMFDKEKLQNIADYIVKEVAKIVNPGDQTYVPSKLLNGIEIELPKWYLHYQGHLLEDQILKAFPMLNRVKRNKEEALKVEIIDKILDDIVDVLSLDILKTFSYIQSS